MNIDTLFTPISFTFTLKPYSIARLVSLLEAYRKSDPYQTFSALNLVDSDIKAIVGTLIDHLAKADLKYLIHSVDQDSLTRPVQCPPELNVQNDNLDLI